MLLDCATAMSDVVRIPLNMTPVQAQRVQALQQGFARLCNALAPVVQSTRVWNRVALHHLTYRQLREQFPEMGSQMVCNAIYSVSRTCRLVFQHPASPFHLDRLGDAGLPLLRFTSTCPVYFDRHTLSLKQGVLSMFTLDGRMRFQLTLDARDEARFHQQKMREIVLEGEADKGYALSFLLGEAQTQIQTQTQSGGGDAVAEIPEYILIEESI